MIIREAVKSDLPAILEIWNHYILETTYNYDYEAKSLVFIEDWFEEKIEKDLPVLAVELENELVGYASFGLFRFRAGYFKSMEHGLYFKPDLIGKGYGKQLLERLIEEAKIRGVHTFMGVIDSTNEGSIRFHKKMGFSEVGRLNEIAVKNGQWLDSVLLQLIF